MGVYIDGLDIPKPIKGIKTCYDILIKSDGSVEEFDSDGRNEYKAEEIDLVRCRECKWAKKEGDEGEGNLTCACHIPRFIVPSDGFCYLGERKGK